MTTTGYAFDVIAPTQPLRLDTKVKDAPKTPKPDADNHLPAPYGPDSPHPDHAPKRQWWRERQVWIPAVSLVVLVALFGFIAYGTTLSLSQTYLASASISPTASQPQLTTTLQKAQQAYRFSITYPDKHTASYALSDAGVSIDTAKTATDFHTKLQHSGPRRFIWWRPLHYTVATKSNNLKLDSFIREHAISSNAPTVDASLSVTGGTTTITASKDGTGYTIPGGRTYLLQNVARLKPANLTLAPSRVPAAVTAQDLATAKTKAEAYLNKSVSFGIDGQTVVASKADIAGWLDVSSVPAAHTADVSVNSGKVLAYITALSAKYGRPPVSEVQTTDDAGNVSVLIAGSDGVDITNKDTAATAAAAALQRDTPATIDLAVSHVAHTTVHAGDYDKWIVADLTTKRMYAYEHTTLVRSFLISAGAPKTPTVVGQYKIYSKYVSKDMTGKNADGSRYFQPHVHYVNFFYKDYAIHGNYWRPTSYFGNINSSHGCVGITDSDAAWLYDWAPIGTTVITHA